ncbi:MAG TPA: diaminopimelate epimerase [Candidatus Aminicenantes bacterium]|nr:diaminopimelate epimerase [Candidatus Aminicenantes bacterium]
MRFTKVHSLGNDFIVLDPDESAGIVDVPGLARRLCDRHLGVGADGLLLISIKDRERGLVHFRIFNADGSEPEISGNGLRCAAAYLFHQNKINPPDVTFLTNIGNRLCNLLEVQNNRTQIRIEMGTPRLTSKEIPFDDGVFHEKIIDYPLSIHHKIYPVTVVSLGNPHCAVFYDRFPARIEWHEIGREIEYHPFFPNRINVEFIRVLSRREIDVLFWERGVGETLSSGSCSSAAAVASILKGLTDRKVTVKTFLGQVIVEWEEDKVYQSGPAEIVFDGVLLK